MADTRNRRLNSAPLTEEDLQINLMVGFRVGIGGRDNIEFNIIDALRDIGDIQDRRDARVMYDRLRRRQT